ncbi:MAG: type I 3-dehydroquinate dehydratase [Treponema sp.]|jgi:3-dehydroquinate dehydratase/shikimate dehydrogenase|nr:type I 3-dehydroquinate dehydratase [Treponema sp.]
MAKICLCLTGKTIARDLEVLDKYRPYIDMAELRVDYLDPDERFSIRTFPELAGLPVILTVRRRIDGGLFDNGEGSRVSLLSKGLAFAEADRRRNFAYVDFEEDLEVPGLEDAARTFGTRIIRSFHNFSGVGDIVPRLRNMRRVGNEIVKAAVMPQNLGDVITVYRAAKETSDLEKILVCMGDLGENTRILAELLGSHLSYTAAAGEKDFPAASPGQLDPRNLSEVYRFRSLSAKTKLFGVVGYPLKTTLSPLIFNTVFNHEKIDAIYLPFPTDDLENFLDLAREINLAGASVTVPYKEAIIPFLGSASDTVDEVGACNTLRFDGENRSGINTDVVGFSESLLTFMERKNFRGLRFTVIGAGGAAKAAVREIFRLKGKCLVLNRNSGRARDLAHHYNYKWGGLESQSLDLMDRYSDVIIQTTPVGTFPHTEDDPFALYPFKGSETVMDLIYNPHRTAFLRRALTAGCKILNGFDMLVRQAKYQYQYFFGRDFPEQLIPRLKLCAGQ